MVRRASRRGARSCPLVLLAPVRALPGPARKEALRQAVRAGWDTVDNPVDEATGRSVGVLDQQGELRRPARNPGPRQRWRDRGGSRTGVLDRDGRPSAKPVLVTVRETPTAAGRPLRWACRPGDSSQPAVLCRRTDCHRRSRRLLPEVVRPGRSSRASPSIRSSVGLYPAIQRGRAPGPGLKADRAGAPHQAVAKTVEKKATPLRSHVGVSGLRRPSRRRILLLPAGGSKCPPR